METLQLCREFGGAVKDLVEVMQSIAFNLEPENDNVFKCYKQTIGRNIATQTAIVQKINKITNPKSIHRIIRDFDAIVNKFSRNFDSMVLRGYLHQFDYKKGQRAIENIHRLAANIKSDESYLKPGILKK